MSEYKGIKGFQVQTRTEDPTPYAQALADDPYAGSWSSGGARNEARGALGGSIMGTQTANVAAGGNLSGSVSANAETYNCTLKDNKNIIFDRAGHSHFKKCIGNICDNEGYGIIHVDERFLIFGNIKFQKLKQKQYFQIFIIDKELKRVEEISKDALNAPEVKNMVIEELRKIGSDYIF